MLFARIEIVIVLITSTRIEMKQMNATETETETARNTNHVDALRRMSNAFLYESGRQISRTIE